MVQDFVGVITKIPPLHLPSCCALWVNSGGSCTKRCTALLTAVSENILPHKFTPVAAWQRPRPAAPPAPTAPSHWRRYAWPTDAPEPGTGNAVHGSCGRGGEPVGRRAEGTALHVPGANLKLSQPTPSQPQCPGASMLLPPLPPSLPTLLPTPPLPHAPPFPSRSVITACSSSHHHLTTHTPFHTLTSWGRAPLLPPGPCRWQRARRR